MATVVIFAKSILYSGNAFQPSAQFFSSSRVLPKNKNENTADIGPIMM
jgi:hypothetical protein